MRLRRRLDAEFARGREDGRWRAVPDPTMSTNDIDYRFASWAYSAGFKEGRREAELARSLYAPRSNPATPPPPTKGYPRETTNE